MNTKDLVAEKKNLEVAISDSIRSLVNKFERDSGIKITSVSVATQGVTTRGELGTRVDLYTKVSLDV